MALSVRQEEALSLLLTGLPAAEVAQRLGTSPSVVYRWMKEPQFAAALEQAKDQLRQRVMDVVGNRLAEEAPRSLDTVVALRDGARSERTRLAAAQDILDRAGFKAVERVHQLHEHILSPEFAELIRRVMEEDRNVVDADVVGVQELPERTRTS
jgi:transposase